MIKSYVKHREVPYTTSVNSPSPVSPHPTSVAGFLDNSTPSGATAKPEIAKAEIGKPEMSVVVLHDATELAKYVPAWERLCEAAIEPNVFYEPWMLLPAIEAFGAGQDLRFVLILLAAPQASPETATLCGFFPLECKSRYEGLPVPVFRFWQHLYCFLNTPLLHGEYAREAMEVFFKWAGSAAGAPLIEFNHCTGDSAFQQLLVNHLQAHARLSFIKECSTRALCCPGIDSETYIHGALSRKRRKEFQRQSNRLEELGKLEYNALTADDLTPTAPQSEAEALDWIEEFMALEASGWKGREGTAFASREADREYFRTIALEAYRRNRLMLLALRLNGQPIAQKFNLLAGHGSFSLKIAFDESYSRYSPGVLLELENIRRLHTMPRTQWMDSCAIPDHSMINRLWTERRIIQTTVIATGKVPGEFVVSCLPLFRWLNRKLRRTDKTTMQEQQLKPEISH